MYMNTVKTNELLAETLKRVFPYPVDESVKFLNSIRDESIIKAVFECLMLRMPVEGLKEMLLAITKDIRVIIIKSAEMLGRVLGGLFQYLKEIPVKFRFLYTKIVYTTFNISDAMLLFLPYPFALANRFICGIMGNVSATIRETATQIYIDPSMRARVNGFFNVIFAIFSTIGNACIGLLGEVMPYPWACALLASISMIACILLIFRNKEDNRKVYEATRTIIE